MERRGVCRAYPLFTLLVGLAAYLIGGGIGGVISCLLSGEFIILAFGAPVGSLLMLFFLRRLTKEIIIKVAIGSEAAGLAGVFAGFSIGELISAAMGPLLPAFRDFIPNILLLVVADAIFGAAISWLLYGRKAIGVFALGCGIISIPFGVLLSMPMDIAGIGFDQNLLLMVASFGAATGFSIGLADLLKSETRG